MSVLYRAGALVASAALTLSGVGLVAAPATATASTDPRPVSIATDWLTSQLTDGIVVGRYLDQNNVEQHYDDFGLTMDIGLSFAATGNASGAGAISDALAPQVADAYESFGTTYTGSAAKAAVFARAVGDDPTSYGGVDLVGVVEDNTATAAPISGRIQNVNDSFGDANVFGQAFAARALSDAGSTKAASAVDFLLAQQCDDGFFRLDFTTSKVALDQTCQGAVGTDASAPDTDATAMAVLELSAITGNSAIAPALAKAKTWLLANQHADGSFGGGKSTEAANGNSTGLAGWALGELGSDAAATKAAVWIRMHQVDELTGCPTQLSSATGAIGYDDATIAAGRADGITIGSEDRWRRTTSPILPVLAYAPAGTPALEVSGPSASVKGGSVVVYSITGVVPGEKVCVSAVGRKKTVAAGADGTARVAFTMPDGTGHRTVTISDRHGNTASVRTDILGAKTLTVTVVPTKVKRGAILPVTVSGLAPGEHVKVSWRGTVVRGGYADTHGVFRTRFGVGQTPGIGTVLAVGKYTDIRRGYDQVTVIG